MRVLAIFNIIYFVASLKTCRNCRFYLPSFVGGKYEIGDYFSKCKKFGYVNTNTSEIEYTYSVTARLEESQCGKKAKNHEKRDREESYYAE